MLHELRRQKTEGQLELLPPKERQSTLRRAREARDEPGRRGRHAQAAATRSFVIDMKKEALAVREARRLNIPVIGLVDTNCDPDDADFVIPGNDDAIRSSALIMRVLADGVAEGRNRGVKVSDFVSENGDAAREGAEGARGRSRPPQAARPTPRPRPRPPAEPPARLDAAPAAEEATPSEAAG